MPSLPIGTVEGLCFGVVCLWVHMSVCVCVHRVSTITPEWIEGFWPNLIQIFCTVISWTDWVLKVEGSRSRSLQDHIFEWVIVADGGIHIEVLSALFIGRCYVDVCCLQDSKSDERFHVELHFSPGVYSVGQNKEYLAGRGYRPQHGEKKQVPCYVLLLRHQPSANKSFYNDDSCN